jgi:hypothetical protein
MAESVPIFDTSAADYIFSITSLSSSFRFSCNSLIQPSIAYLYFVLCLCRNTRCIIIRQIYYSKNILRGKVW